MTDTEPMTAARERLARGDVMGAFQALRPLLDYPGALDDDAEAAATLVLFAEIAGALGGPELGSLVALVAKAPRDPGALYDVAYTLYEQKQHSIAATLLTRANRLHPGSQKIVYELASSLEALGANSHAALVLGASGLAKRDPMGAYLLAFHLLMTGDIEGATEHAPSMDSDAPDAVRFMADALDAMLVRARAVGASLPLEGRALTAWHAILNGSLLLHESPHGYEEPMHGRYAYLGDGPGLMREGITKLETVLEHAGRRPRHVVAAPDRASHILATATARRFGLPLLPFSDDVLTDCLVVAWNLDAIGDASVLEALRSHRRGQVLWAHASSWTDPFPYAPDVTTLLHQTVTHPWLGGAMTVDPETQAVTAADPDARADDVLAGEIAAGSITDPSACAAETLPRVLDALRPLAPGATLGIWRDEGRRLHQRVGSPVPSARFT